MQYRTKWCCIKPLKPDEHNDKYIYFDFETLYEHEKHTANYVCAISQGGEVFTAEGVGCVDQMIKHFRRPKKKLVQKRNFLIWTKAPAIAV